MIKSLKLFATSLFGGLLCIYCTAFMWFEVPEIFFKTVGVVAFFIIFIYLLLLVVKEIIKE